MSQGTLERCEVVVSEGRAVARYRWSDCGGDGCDRLDDDVSDWSDEEIIEHVCLLVGVERAEDKAVIKVVRE